MDGETTDALTDWMTRQRWYGGKGRLPRLTEIGAFDLAASDEVTARTLLLLDTGGSNPALYQVPVTIRSTIPKGAGSALIGPVGDRYLFDGVQDAAYTSALLALVADGGTAAGEVASASGTPAGRAVGDPAAFTARVLSGEQSNTSIVYEATDGTAPVICKVFRALHHGENPDVVLQTALSAAGSTHVPVSVGYLTGEWPDTGRGDGVARGHLAFAQEFLPGVEDAWRVALQAGTDGVDFTADAFALGEATAEVHRTLASATPTKDPSVGDVAALVSAWHARLAAAVAEVPELARHRAAIEAVYDAAQNRPWPTMQRIHGDYHLGQVLLVPGRGWVLVDFEGEPLRPMHERDRPDEPLRDVAGMLRSFDYVAGSVARSGGAAGEVAGGASRDRTRAAEAWARAARQAFLAGYATDAHIDVEAHRALLDAFELDKAVYEAVYEARNRPAWLPIPVDAIARLVPGE